MKAAVLWLLFVLLPVGSWEDNQSAEKLIQEITTRRVHLVALEAAYEFHSSPSDRIKGTGLGQTRPGDRDRVRQTVFFRAPDRIRLNLSWPDREEVFLASNLKTLVMVGDQATDTPWPQPFLLYRLLIETDPDRMVDLMTAFDIDLSKISLSPDENYIIIGAEPEDKLASQVWFEGRTLRLKRLFLAPTNQNPAYDINLSDYLRHQPGMDWPHTITVRLGQEKSPAMVMTLKSFGLNLQTPKEPFDLDEIRRTVAAPPDTGPSSEQNPDVAEIRKMMEWLNKKLELSRDRK